MRDLPLIDATGVTRAQRLGRECVACRKRFPRPSVPVGQLGTGEILYRCPECQVVLEVVDAPMHRIPAPQSESDGRP